MLLARSWSQLNPMIPISLFEAAHSSVEFVSRAISALRIEKRAFIDGQYCDTELSIEGKCSPVDGQAIPGVASCDAAMVGRAVAAARRSYDLGVWRRCDRRSILLRLADSMQGMRGELALLDCLETGRALQNYYYDSIPKAIDALRWFAENYVRLRDESLSAPSEVVARIVRQPIGVAGLITPWNDPLVPVMWKLGAALMMGNSVVLKPSEYSSLSVLRVAQLAVEAGVPAGVLNVVPGLGAIAGAALAQHPDVDVIGFTGSSETAGQILQFSGRTNLKRVEAECGGKSAFLVTGRCQRLREAAECLAENLFYNQGQICSAPSRLIIERSVRSQFLPLLVSAAGGYLPGHAFDVSCRIGSLVSRRQRERVQSYLDEGARTATQLTAFSAPLNPLAVAPVIFDEVDPGSRLAQEEIFGPVLAVLTADTFEQAIVLANGTRFGLAAGVWTDCEDEAARAIEELRAGIVHINCYGEDTMEAPFGGMKASGFGKDKSLLAFDGYSLLKTTWQRSLP